MNQGDKGIFDELMAAIYAENFDLVNSYCERFPKIMFFRRNDNLTPLHLGIMKNVSDNMVKLMLEKYSDPGIAEVGTVCS